MLTKICDGFWIDLNRVVALFKFEDKHINFSEEWRGCANLYLSDKESVTLTAHYTKALEEFLERRDMQYAQAQQQMQQRFPLQTCQRMKDVS